MINIGPISITYSGFLFNYYNTEITQNADTEINIYLYKNNKLIAGWINFRYSYFGFPFDLASERVYKVMNLVDVLKYSDMACKINQR